MTMILIDPSELTVASETLRSCAAETADIGSQLWACAQCAMPPELAAAINNIVSTADRVLDATAAVFQLRATDIAMRAAIAANDPVAATSAATAPSTLAMGNVIGGMNVAGGGGPFGDGGGYFTGGGFSAIAATTVGGGGPFGDGGGFFTGGGFSAIASTTVGGDPFGNGSGYFTGAGAGVIGATTVGGGGGLFGDGAPIYTGLGTGSRRNEPLAVLGQNLRDRSQATLDTLFRSNLTPAELGRAMQAQVDQNKSIGQILAPTVSDLERQFGYRPSDSQIRGISPYILPQPTNLFGTSPFG